MRFYGRFHLPLMVARFCLDSSFFDCSFLMTNLNSFTNEFKDLFKGTSRHTKSFLCFFVKWCERYQQKPETISQNSSSTNPQIPHLISYPILYTHNFPDQDTEHTNTSNDKFLFQRVKTCLLKDWSLSEEP